MSRDSEERKRVLDEVAKLRSEVAELRAVVAELTKPRPAGRTSR